jgi:quinol monooxygenase YgiN
MITRVVKLEVDPEKADQFKTYFDEVCEHIRAFSGCMSLELLQDVEAVGVFFTISRWSDMHSFEAYKQSALFQGTWTKVKPLFVAKAQAWSLGLEKDLTGPGTNPFPVS